MKVENIPVPGLTGMVLVDKQRIQDYGQACYLAGQEAGKASAVESKIAEVHDLLVNVTDNGHAMRVVMKERSYD